MLRLFDIHRTYQAALSSGSIDGAESLVVRLRDFNTPEQERDELWAQLIDHYSSGSWRPDFNLYLDEFQNYLHLPQSLDEILVEARGYHLNPVLANQHLGQLAGPTREALASNARTRVVFQCGQEDARYLAREFDPWLQERHLRNLEPYQVAVRMFSSGHTVRPFTGRTRPAADAPGADNSERLIDSALERHGHSRDVVEVEIATRLGRFGFDDGSEEAPL